MTGGSAAWLARNVRDVEAVGSNPTLPTIFIMTSYRLVFKGNVQGVGFRFTVERIAAKFGITGWVRNNPDGSVETVAEGEKEKLDVFVDDVKNYFNWNISDCIQSELPATGKFKDFSITYY